LRKEALLDANFGVQNVTLEAEPTGAFKRCADVEMHDRRCSCLTRVQCISRRRVDKRWQVNSTGTFARQKNSKAREEDKSWQREQHNESARA